MITVYSKLRCPKCDEVKDFLEREGHHFTTKDITNDLIKLQEFRPRVVSPYVGTGFPVVDFDGEVIAGDVEAIKAKANSLK